jgi:hypothetical protein
MRRWTDGQECPIEIKGSQWTAYWERVIITAKLPRTAWFRHVQYMQLQALKVQRRLRDPESERRRRLLEDCCNPVWRATFDS